MKALFFIYFSLLTQFLYAQIITSDWQYMVGQEHEFKTILLDEPFFFIAEEGKGQTWDLSDVNIEGQSLGSSYEVVDTNNLSDLAISLGANLGFVSPEFPGVESLMNQSDSCINIIGETSPDGSLFLYDEGGKLLKFPFEYGESFIEQEVSYTVFEQDTFLVNSRIIRDKFIATGTVITSAGRAENCYLIRRFNGEDISVPDAVIYSWYQGSAINLIAQITTQTDGEVIFFGFTPNVDEVNPQKEIYSELGINLKQLSNGVIEMESDKTIDAILQLTTIDGKLIERINQRIIQGTQVVSLSPISSHKQYYILTIIDQLNRKQQSFKLGFNY